MELHYRGTTYGQPSASVETVESAVVGHYRGAALKFRNSGVTSEHNANTHMKYRGAQVR